MTFLCSNLSLYLCLSLFPLLRHPFRLSYFWYLFAMSTPLAGIVNFKAPRRKSSVLSELFVVFLGWMWVFKKIHFRASNRREKDELPWKDFIRGLGFSNICSWGDCRSFRESWKAAAKPVNCTLYPREYRQLCGNRTSCQHGYLTASGSTC